jgi:hypothetical protein
MHDGITVDESRGIIMVDSYGKSSKEDIAKAISEAQQLFANRGFYKILVDTTKQESMPSTIDIFELFSSFPREFRTAMVLDKNQETEGGLSFAETVGVNRGVRIRKFYNRELALQWLDEQ